MFESLANCSQKALEATRLKQKAVFTMVDQFRERISIGGYDRQAAGHCFHGGKALQVRLRGYYEHV